MGKGRAEGGMTRREALKRGAVVAGAAAWTTPAVQAIRMSQALAQDVSGFGTDCCDPKVDLRNLTFLYQPGPCLPVGDGGGIVAREAQEECDGAQPTPGTVYIIASEKKPEDLFDGDGSFNGKIYFAGPVSDGDFFTADAGVVGDDKLKSSTYLTVFQQGTAPDSSTPVAQFVKLHTSCSKALPLGEVFASFSLVECNSGGSGNSCCDAAGGEIAKLTLEYTASLCQNPLPNTQSGKALCAGFGTPGATARIIVTQEKNLGDALVEPAYFDGIIAAGATLDATAAAGGESTFKSDTYVYVLDPDTNGLIQEIEFHTSCSQPLDLGDEFGAIKVIECSGESGIITDDSCCEAADGDIKGLSFVFTGAACAVPLANAQEGKATCSDVGAVPLTSRVIVTKESDLGDALVAPSFFDDSVTVGDIFTASASAAGENSFKSDTYVYVLDPATSALLQEVQFHTSCSKPLGLNDEFGAVQIVDCMPDDPGGHDEPADGESCCEPGKPMALQFLYSGSACQAPAAHGQAEGTYTCEEFGVLPTTARIIISQHRSVADAIANPAHHDATVEVGRPFTAAVGNAGGAEFTAETYGYILDDTDTVVQSIKFDASCGQPLMIGDAHGALTIIAASQDPDGIDLVG